MSATDLRMRLPDNVETRLVNRTSTRPIEMSSGCWTDVFDETPSNTAQHRPTVMILLLDRLDKLNDVK